MQSMDGLAASLALGGGAALSSRERQGRCAHHNCFHHRPVLLSSQHRARTAAGGVHMCTSHMPAATKRLAARQRHKISHAFSTALTADCARTGRLKEQHRSMPAGRWQTTRPSRRSLLTMHREFQVRRTCTVFAWLRQ